MIDLATLSNDEAAFTAEFPATLSFLDQDVIGMCGAELQTQQLTEEGFHTDLNIEFRALISRFKTPSTAPFNNQEFTHKESGQKYRILKVIRDNPTNLSYILTCVSLCR